MISSGELGNVVSFRVNWGEYLPNWHPWEDYKKSYAARADLGGGVTLTLCHPFDYLRWLFSDEVSKLWAFTSTSAEIAVEVDAVAEVGLHFKKGAVGTVHLDYLQRPGSHTLEITCTKGRLLWDNATAQLRCYRVEDENWQQYDPPIGFERNWLFIEEMKAFLALVRGEIESPCTLNDGINALEIVQGVQFSAAAGKMIRFG
jgi:predicted dehydrogenase